MRAGVIPRSWKKSIWPRSLVEPNQSERAAVTGHIGAGQDRRKAWEDVVWALLNSKEFLLRH